MYDTIYWSPLEGLRIRDVARVFEEKVATYSMTEKDKRSSP